MPAYFLYFLKTTKFPSWTSPVRTRSPAPTFQSLASIQTTVGSNWLHLVYCEGRLQLVHRFAAALERSPGVDIFVYINGVPHLFGANLWIDIKLLHEAPVSPAHHLEIDPGEADRF